MSEQPHTTHKTEEAREGFASKITTTLVGLLSVGVGLYVLDLGIKNNAYKNWARKDLFKDIQQKYEAEYAKTIGEATKEQSANTIKTLVEKIDGYREDVKKFFQDKGFDSNAKYWQILNRNQKARTVVEASSAGGIVLGAGLSVVNSKSWKRLVSEPESTEQTTQR